jgi:hypothetical protein
MIMRIDEQASTVVAMSGEVNLAHAFGGHPGEIEVSGTYASVVRQSRHPIRYTETNRRM